MDKESISQSRKIHKGKMGHAAKWHLLSVFTIVSLGVVCYAHTLTVPFLFDDLQHINRNPHIRLRSLNLEQIYDAALKSPHQRRPVANISFALNYYLGAYDPTGYHTFNIAVHLINGVLVYFLALFTLRQYFNTLKRGDSEYSSSFPHAPYGSLKVVSLLTALIFVSHPLQTQSVTYIVQRMNSMAAMFSLLSLLLYIRGRLREKGSSRWALWSASLLSWVLALGSKEIAVTLPFIVFLYEWYFFQALSSSWLRKHIVYLFIPFACFGLIAVIYLGADPLSRIGAIYEYRDFTMGERVLTQFRVLLFYISLLICPLPSRLNLLHHFPLSHSLLDPVTTLLSLLAIASLLYLAVRLARRERIVSFCVVWFFVNLIVESSLVGLELVFEHRLYLPMFGFALLTIYLPFRLLSEKRLWAVALSLAIVSLLGTATYARNGIWRDEVHVWTDVLSKNPQSARAHLNLGSALMPLGKLDEAVFHYREALRIEPYYVRAHNNLGLALKEMGRLDEAFEHYSMALKIKPDYVDARNNLGLALKEMGRLDEAVSHYREALRINPHAAEVHNNLGIALQERGELDQAVRHYKEALRLDPLLADARFNLAVALVDQGRIQEAISQFAESLRLHPEDWQAHSSLGNALAQQGRLDEAIEHLSVALDIRPDYAQGHSNLGLALAAKGRLDEAIAHYQEALKIEPDSEEALNNLALALTRKGALSEAISHYQRALKIKPNSPELLMNMGNALARRGQLDEAVKHLSMALELRPDYAEAHNNLGIVWARQGDFKKAIARFREALRLKPDYAEARHNLDLARAQSGMSPEPARSVKP